MPARIGHPFVLDTRWQPLEAAIGEYLRTQSQARVAAVTGLDPSAISRRVAQVLDGEASYLWLFQREMAQLVAASDLVAGALLSVRSAGEAPSTPEAAVSQGLASLLAASAVASRAQHATGPGGSRVTVAEAREAADAFLACAADLHRAARALLAEVP